MADPNQTPERGDWACPCNGCRKAKKLALRQVQEILDKDDIVYSWWQAQIYIKEELNKK